MCAAAMLPMFTSCGESAELDYLTRRPAGEIRRVERALLFYFVGTSLDGEFRENLTDVRQAVTADPSILDDARIVYFRRATSGGEWAISEIYYDREKGSAETKTLKRYAEPDLSLMDDYLNEMVQLVPANHYGLVLGGHGSGWLPTSIGSSWTSKYSVGQQPSAYVAPFGEAPREGAAKTRYFGESNCTFDLEQIAECMIGTGVKFDYMIFDDCFMSNIESLYAMRHAVDRIIASPCEIMAAGFPYQRVIPRLFAPDGKCDLEGVCKAFYEYYISDSSIRSGCIALTVCSELEPLAEAYRRLVAGPTVEVDRAQLQYYEGLSEHLFYDMGQYAERLSADASLLDEFRRRFDAAFPESCRLHTPYFYTAFGSDHFVDVDYYSGVTISEPARRNTDLNRETEWYRATHR